MPKPTLRLWLIRIISFLGIAVPAVIGLGFIIGTLIFSGYGDSSGEETKLIVEGSVFIAAACLNPLQSRRRLLLSFGLFTIAALVGIGLYGQTDQLVIYGLYVIITLPIFFIKQKLLSKAQVSIL